VGRKSLILKAQQKIVQDIKKGKQSTIYSSLGARKIPQEYPSIIVLSFNMRGVRGAQNN
jgi:hypothetical protein